MRLGGRRKSSNVEDQRSSGGRRIGIPRSGRTVRTSGMSLSGIIMLVILFFVLRACGIDPMQILGGAGGFDQSAQTTQTRTAPSNDAGAVFASKVLASTEDVWDGIFQAYGRTYPKPKLVLFSGNVSSACGFASAASGPFYCPGDNKVYIDLDFYDELERKFGAGGDFAQAYVLAHEVGHHVQNIIGVLPKFNQMRQSMSKVEANAMSIRVELQADCFAGVWGYHVNDQGLLDAGDVDEALNAATQIGDDAIQKRTQGYVVPESFNHGTSAQRKDWFYRGFKSGKIEACDTMGAAL